MKLKIILTGRVPTTGCTLKITEVLQTEKEVVIKTEYNSPGGLTWYVDKTDATEIEVSKELPIKAYVVSLATVTAELDGKRVHVDTTVIPYPKSRSILDDYKDESDEDNRMDENASSPKMRFGF